MTENDTDEHILFQRAEKASLRFSALAEMLEFFAEATRKDRDLARAAAFDMLSNMVIECGEDLDSARDPWRQKYADAVRVIGGRAS